MSGRDHTRRELRITRFMTVQVSPDPALAEELAFLDFPERSVPHRLPLLVELLGKRRQLEIARDELPRIARTIGAPHTRQRLMVAVPEQARRFAAAAHVLDGRPTDVEVETVLCSMRVGEENLASELDSPLLNYVVRSASSLALDALLGPQSGFRIPDSFRRLGRWGRRPIVGLAGRRLLRTFGQGTCPGTYTCRASAAAAP